MVKIEVIDDEVELIYIDQECDVHSNDNLETSWAVQVDDVREIDDEFYELIEQNTPDIQVIYLELQIIIHIDEDDERFVMFGQNHLFVDDDVDEIIVVEIEIDEMLLNMELDDEVELIYIDMVEVDINELLYFVIRQLADMT
jgi:hypothetical protein